MLLLQPPKPTENNKWLFQMSRNSHYYGSYLSSCRKPSYISPTFAYMRCYVVISTAQKHLFVFVSLLKHLCQSVHISCLMRGKITFYLYSRLNFSAEHFKHQRLPRNNCLFHTHSENTRIYTSSICQISN